MYCTSCGAKLPEGARFCTSCGASVGQAPMGRVDQAAGAPKPAGAGLAAGSEQGGRPTVPAGGPEAPADGGRPAGLGARMVQFRRTALAAAPTWALALLALLLAAGTAFAVYKVVTVWALPALVQEDADEAEEATEEATEDVEEVDEEAAAEEEEEAEPTEEELALAAYGEIIAEYKEAFSQIDQVDEWDWVDVDDSFPGDAVVSGYWQNEVFSEYPHVSYAVASETWRFCENLYYCLVDIDGNGVSELIFSSGYGEVSSTIDAAFTYADGQLVMLFDGWDRCFYQLCEDGTIACYSSSGAATILYQYLELDGTTFTVVEEISQENDYDWENLIYSHTVDGVVVEEGSVAYGDSSLAAVVAEWIEEAKQAHVEMEVTDWVQLV